MKHVLHIEYDDEARTMTLIRRPSVPRAEYEMFTFYLKFIQLEFLDKLAPPGKIFAH